MDSDWFTWRVDLKTRKRERLSPDQEKELPRALQSDRLARLTEKDGRVESPSWAPDERKVVFVRWGGILAVLDLDTGKEELLGEGTSPVWSP